MGDLRYSAVWISVIGEHRVIIKEVQNSLMFGVERSVVWGLIGDLRSVDLKTINEIISNFIPKETEQVKEIISKLEEVVKTETSYLRDWCNNYFTVFMVYLFGSVCGRGIICIIHYLDWVALKRLDVVLFRTTIVVVLSMDFIIVHHVVGCISTDDVSFLDYTVILAG